jgi:polyhydroxyalkanoate synthase
MAATEADDFDQLAVPLDLLLTRPVFGLADRVAPNLSWPRFALSLARQPRTVASRTATLGKELGAIVTGRSELAPAKGDGRFTDPAWTGNPLLRRTMQAYLAANDTVNQLFSDANLDWRDAERMRFVLDFVTDGLAPSNNPFISPLGYKAAIDTGGQSVVRGLRHFVSDMRKAPRLPSMVEPDAYTLGETVAATPGSVVFRTEVFELIQYTPQTDKVWSVPLLMVPPVINKYYVLDMSPGRSMIEYFLKQGHQVFTMSWRNPTAEQRNWDFDTYGQAIIDAMDAIHTVTHSKRVHLQASCSGGILAAMTVAHLTAIGEGERLAGLTLMVTVLDQYHAGFAAAAIDQETADLAIATSASKGYLDGKSLAEVFAWLRPNDLVWRYWVNNYIQGKEPAPFDVLFWNADTTRMAAGLHRDMVMMGFANALTKPDGVSMLGTPVDLSTVTTDTCFVAGVTDHISPWQACYRSARLLENSDRTFVLSSSGHIAALVNPPGNKRASYQVGPVDVEEPADWAKAAETQPDSWWPHFANWLGPRSGRKKAAPEVLGAPDMPPMEPAPGRYVLDR